MQNTAKISIGLLGGRGYGKTVFLTKMIQLADSSEDGFIQFDAGSDALVIKNSLLENDGVLPATQIEEFSRYNFILGKQSGEKYRIQFCDYAGELLERVDIPNKADKKASGGIDKHEEGSDYVDSFVSNEDNKPYIKKLKKWLKKCDAFIVLMPADVTNAKKYSSAEIKIYRQNIGVIMKVMQDDCILKNRPVCLAINKWDLAERNTNFDDIIKSEPFASFRQQLKNMCGKNLFCMPISAFGKHSDDNPYKAAPDGKPVNVSECLIKLVEKAEYSKIVSVKNTIESLSPLMSWLFLPLILLYSWFEGATNARLVKLNSLLYKKYVKVVAYRTVIVLVAFFLVVLITGTANLFHDYKTWNRQITNGFNSPQMIEQLENKIFAQHTFDFMFGKRSILMNRHEVMKRFEERKRQYNQDLLAEAISKINEKRGPIGDPDNDALLREEEIKTIKEGLERIKARLTSDAIEKTNIDALQDEMDEIAKQIGKNKPFFDAYNEWGNIADETEKANRASQFLETYTRNKYPDYLDLIERVRKTKLRIEEDRYDRLYATLHNSEDFLDDFGGKTNDYKNRIARARKRIEIINAEKKRIEDSSKLGDMDDLIKKEEYIITYLEEFGPFDSDVEKMLMLNINDDKFCAKKIQDFINSNKSKYFENRQKAFDDLDKRLHEINTSIFENLVKKLAEPRWANVGDLETKKRIENAVARSRDIEDAISQLTDDALISKCKSFKDEEDNLIAELEHYGPFDRERKEILDLPDEEKPVKIDAFLRNHKESDFPLRKNEIKALTAMKERLTNSIYQKLSMRLGKSDPGANWKDRVAIAEDNIKLISAEQKAIPNDLEEYKECNDAIKAEEDLIRQLKHDGPFDDAYNTLLALEKDKSYIRNIEDFLRSYDEKTYPNRKDKIKQLEQELAQREAKLFVDLNALVSPEQKSWKEYVAQLENQVTEIKENIRYFTTGSVYRTNLQEKIDNLNAEILHERKYGTFDDEWNPIEKTYYTASPSESIPQIDSFLKKYSESIYPAKKDVFEKAASFLETNDKLIHDNVVAEIENEAVSSDLPWDAQLTRAKACINIYTSGINKLSSNSKYRREFEDNKENESKLIQRIENYRKYYEAFDDVIAKSELERIPAINAFEKTYQNRFPNPLPQYRIDVLRNMSNDLLEKFGNDLKKQMEEFSDRKTAPADYSERLSLAQERIKALRFYENVSGISMSDEIQKEQMLCDTLQENAEFSRDYTNLIGAIGAQTPKDIFIAIDNFRSKYPEAKWSKERSNDYNSVKMQEETLQNTLADNLKKEMSVCSDFSTHEKALSSYLEQARIIGDALKNYPDSMSAYWTLNRDLAELSLKIQEFQKLCEEEKRIFQLLENSKKVTEDKTSSIGVFLKDIEEFEHDYPDVKEDKRLTQFAELNQVKIFWNEKLLEKMEQALAPREADLKNFLSPEEKKACYDEMFAIYNEYLSSFSPDSSQFKQAVNKRRVIEESSERLETEERLRGYIAKVDEILKADYRDSSQKLSAIESFYKDTNSLGNWWEKYPHFRADKNRIDSRKKDLEWEQEWGTNEKKADHLLKNPPDYEVISDVRKKKDECSRLARILYPYQNDMRSAQRARILYNQLISMNNDLDRVVREYDLYISVKDAASQFESLLYNAERMSSTIAPDCQAFLQAYNNYNQAFPINSTKGIIAEKHAREIRNLYDDLNTKYTNVLKLQKENSLLEVETGYYSSVVNTADLFIKNPTDQNYKNYIANYNNYLHYCPSIQEISSANIKNVFNEHKRVIENWNDDVKIISDVLSKMNDAFISFRDRPSSETLRDFLLRAGKCLEYSIDNSQTSYAKKLDAWINNPLVQVELDGFYFANSGFESNRVSDVDFIATISSSRSQIRFEVLDIGGSSKNSPGYSYLKNRLGEKIKQPMYIPYNDRVSIIFGNYNFSNDIGDASIEFSKILGGAMGSGNYKYSFTSSSKRRPNSGSGSVTIEFYGLPCYTP